MEHGTHVVAEAPDKPEYWSWYRQQGGTVPMNHILVPVVRVAGRRGLTGAGPLVYADDGHRRALYG